MEPIVRIEDLVFQYRKDDNTFEIPAVDRVNLNLEPGSFTAIIGRNGSGKSTLAKNIYGLLIPRAGAVYVKGMNTTDAEKIWEIRQSAGMVFQNPDNQLVSSIVEDDVAFGPENLGIAPLEIRKRVDESLSAVNMYEERKKAPHLLSGGQKQRIAIARALATNPQVLLCDEATSALDNATTSQILELLRELNKTLGITIVVITHEMKVIEHICTRVAVMDESRIAEVGRVSEVFARPKSAIGRRLIFPEGKQTELFHGGRSLRLVFDGKSSFETIISNMILECGAPVNILYADTKVINGRDFGQMVIQLPDNETAGQRMRAFLEAKKVKFEEEFVDVQ